MRKFLAYLKGWRGIALISYMWLILMAYAFIYIDMFSAEMRRRMYFISVAEVILLALVYICPRLLGWAEHQEIGSVAVLTNRDKARVFMKSFFTVLVFFFVMYIIFYPGGLSPDNIGQYHQALTGAYEDHHPAIQTMFAYTLPIKLSGGWLGSVHVFQIIIFSLVLAYMSLTLYEFAGRKYAKWTLIYIILNPATYSMALTPLKDTTYSIAALLVMTWGLRTYFTNGEWLRNKFHAVIFMIVLVLGSLFRHNGILFTLFLLFAVSFYVSKKQAVIMFICFFALIWGIRGPFYRSINVQMPTSTRQIETLGMAMRIIGNSVKESPEKLDREILDFAYSVASPDVWQKHFNVYRGGYDKIKFLRIAEKEDERADSKFVDNQAIERAGWRKILVLMSRCFKKAPLSSLKGALTVSNMIYGIAGGVQGVPRPSIADNDLGLEDRNFFRLDFLADMLKGILTKFVPSGVEGIYKYIDSGKFSLQTIFVLWNYAITILFKHIFWHIGVLNLVVIIFLLAKLKYNRIHDWKRLLLVIPMLAYNYGTMLMMPVADIRYFYFSFLVISPALLVLLKDNHE